MGNCCSEAEQQTAPGAFSGEGHRLGTANETTPINTGGGAAKKDDSLPPPRQDPNLTDDAREQQRLERIAAAEARMKKAGTKPPKKKKENKDAPLKGPNSVPTMRWTAG